MNRVRLQDPVLQQACKQSLVRYEDLGLPQEMTVWVDPGEVSCRWVANIFDAELSVSLTGCLCRYGEHSAPFSVSLVNGCRRGDGEFSRRIHDAVERASLEVQSGSSSDEEEESCGTDSSVSTSSSSLCAGPVQQPNPEPKTIPTVSNPNSVYRVRVWTILLAILHFFELSEIDSFKFLTPPHSSASFLQGLLKPGCGRNGRPSLEMHSHPTCHQPEVQTLSSWTKKASNLTGPLLPSLGLGWTSTTGSANPGHSMSWASDQHLATANVKAQKTVELGKKVPYNICV